MNLQSIQTSFDSIKCTKGMPVQFACINKNCFHIPFTCSDKLCQCKIQHKKCLMVQTNTIVQSLQNKIIPVQTFSQIINQRIQKMIDYLSDLRQRTQIKIKQKFQHCGLNESQINLLQYLKNQDVNSITAKLLWQSTLDLQPTQSIINFRQNSCQYLNKLFDNGHQYIKQLNLNIQNQLQEYQKFVNESTDYLKIVRQLSSKNQSSNYIKIHSSSMIKESLVVKSNQQFKILQSFFQTQFKKATLLYRASQHNFLTSKFHYYCDDIPNTLILVHNQFDHKIGGFTPIAWNSNGNSMPDDTGKSFIFSLTKKAKFSLVGNQKAISGFRGSGPIFGNGNDLHISNQANLNASSYNYANVSYKSSNCSGIHGNPNNDIYFKIKEWQVWKLQF